MTDPTNTGSGAPPPPVWNAQPAAGDGFAARGYGGFWLRVVAYIIDGVVVGIPTWILGGLRVVTERGERLSFANATGRYFAKFISTVLLLIGFIMVAFTDRKRGLHDIMASTVVVKV